MEALGLLGFISTAISTVTNQIPDVDHRIKDYKACEKKLLLYRDQLDACFRQLNAWYQHWGHDFDGSYEVYREIWGRRNFDGICASLATVKGHARDIYTSMRTNHDLDRQHTFRNTPQNVARWLGLSKPPRRERYGIRDLKIIEKIGFSLFRSDYLNEQVEQIRQAIADLDIFAKDGLRDRGYAGQEDQISSAHVRTYRNMVSMSRFASALYDSLRPTSFQYSWEMRLRWPDAQDGDAHFRDIANDMRMEFSTYFATRRKSDGSIFNAVVHLIITQDQRSNGATRNLESLTSEDFAWIEDFEIFFENRYYRVRRQRKPLGRRRSIRKSLDSFPLAREERIESRADYLVETARALIIVTLWFIVFLKTRWFAHLCGCRVHCMRLDDDAPRLLFRGPHQDREYLYRPCIAPHADKCHHEPSHKSQRLQLLAALYVEILLGQRFCLFDRQGDLYFQNSSGQEYSEREILDLVSEVAPLNMAKAVEYCLHGRDPGKHIYNDTVNIDQIEKMVLLPLLKFATPYSQLAQHT